MNRSVQQIVAIFGAIISMALFAAPAQAQATRTWVSGVGDDANPCSRTAPCKTFAGAISKTAASGEINVLDPGGFGAVTITKSISIISTFEAGVLVSGTNGIIVNVASTDKVLLEGLDIEGLGTGLDGVKIIGGGNTVIRKCSIRGFTQNGIHLAGTSGARVAVDQSAVLNNGGGLNVEGSGGVTNTALAFNTLFGNNTSFAVRAGPGSALALSGNQMFNSTTSIVNAGAMTIDSYGNNLVRNGGTSTDTLPLE
jgi:hypothetical protein